MSASDDKRAWLQKLGVNALPTGAAAGAAGDAETATGAAADGRAPTIAVKSNGDGTFVITGSGFVANSPALISATDRQADREYGVAQADGGGAFSFTTRNICPSPPPLTFIATSGVGSKTDRTDWIWSNIVQTACPADSGKDPGSGDDPDAPDNGDGSGDDGQGGAAGGSDDGSQGGAAGGAGDGSQSGAAAGSDDGSQGGAAAGSDDGSQGGAAAGSDDGSQSGAAAGSDDGSQSGAAAGSDDGSQGGAAAGSDDGSQSGAAAGSDDGSQGGAAAGSDDGSQSGAAAGSDDGSQSGAAAGSSDGSQGGAAAGSDDGSQSGAAAGSDDGSQSGAAAGSGDGSQSGAAAGSDDGSQGGAAGGSDDASQGGAAGGSDDASQAGAAGGAGDTGTGGPAAANTSDGTTDNKKKPKGTGWRQMNIIVTLTDFDGAPMGGREVILQFKAPGAEVIDAGGSMDGGTITFAGVWLQPEGTVRVVAINKGSPAIVPDGNTNYKLPGSGPLKIKGVQQKKEITVTAKTSEEASEKAGVEGTAGIDYKVVKAEVKGTSEEESKKGSEVTYTFIVTAGKPALDLTIL